MWWYQNRIEKKKKEDKKRIFADVAADRKIKRDKMQKMYQSSSWKKLRLQHLSSNPYCAMCYREDRITKAYLVHHIKSAIDYPELFLEPTNLESACLSCHSKHEWKEAQARRKRRKIEKGKKIMEDLERTD